ncbi:MAG TPA: methyltransferase domain-containing protein, partial [Blastocatellia bacterium]
MLTPKRIYMQEMLDAGVGTDDDVSENLADLRFINRRLGGAGIVLGALEKVIAGEKAGRLSLLDIGTGSADIPNEVSRRWTSREIKSHIVALDLSSRNLRVARTRLGIEPGIELVQADALSLPFAPKSFDFV